MPIAAEVGEVPHLDVAGCGNRRPECRVPISTSRTRSDGRARAGRSDTRVYKEHKHSTRRIDLAVCAIMAHSVTGAVVPGPQLYRYDDAR